ncbi:unnamed protein product [Thlaspi arvense]|uniref:NAC domain-containing protein n=1 Tax=Thlaspi arvense TaxID=13288 RepID=A0AAU9SZ68_THLAR|nr:unnamed protein product [Thlaspi arvense]
MSDRASPASEAVPAAATDNDAAAALTLTPVAPGLRFHPSDEELISYYLKRKVQSKPMALEVIAEVDVYKIEPSDLPEHSRLKTKDQEWFFFSAMEKKKGRSGFMNRATNKGFWKQSGKDKKILRGDKQLIGTMKTLVFYNGRSPKGQHTNWMIHEYCLAENDQGLEIDKYALCKVILKKHAGPLKGHVYAPFSEQEWDDDDGGGAHVPSVVHANAINEIQQDNHSQNKNLNDPKTADNGEPLAKECLPLCGIDKEAPRRLIGYKRKGNCNNSSQTTQDHCSSPAATGDTISSVGATLEENVPEPVATMVPTSSSTELISDMEKKKEQMSEERKTYELEKTRAELMISLLQEQIDALRAENEELKRNNSNKGLCS